MEATSEKKSLRASIRQHFQINFKPEARQAEAASISAQLRLRLNEFKSHHPLTLLAYWPSLPEEPDFQAILGDWINQGNCLGLPELVWSGRTLCFRQVTNLTTDLVADSKGLVQPQPDLPLLSPASASLILVPGLAFDRFGNRLGRGAGFYDRFLVSTGSKIPRLAPAFSCQIVEKIHAESWDQPVHQLILPDGLRNCR